MFLTGFLTGFAKQAQASIEERNKEMREGIDDTLKEKAEEVEKDRILKKKERADLKERSTIFSSSMDTDMEGLQLSTGQQLAIISDEKSYNKFIEDIAEFRDADPKAKEALVKRIKKRFGGKMNIDPNMSLDQAIIASTQLDEIIMPTVTNENTALGIPSNIQQRAIERFKGRMPKELTGTRAKKPVVGRYQGFADVQDITQSESNKLVANFYENAIRKVFLSVPGAKKDSQLVGIRKGIKSEINKLLVNRDNRDITGVIKHAQVQSQIATISKLDQGYADAIKKLREKTINEVIKSYASKDGFISPNLARALQSTLDLDIGDRVGRAKDKVFIADFDTRSKEKEGESVTTNIINKQDKKKQISDITKEADKEKFRKSIGVSTQNQANNNLKNLVKDYRDAKNLADRMAAINTIKKQYNITGDTEKDVILAADKILKGDADTPTKNKPSIVKGGVQRKSLQGKARSQIERLKRLKINSLVQNHKLSVSNRKKDIEKELAEKYNMTIEDARKYIEEEKKAGRI